MPLAVYNGKMYAGTLPLAEVYRFDGQQDWTHVGRLDRTPEVRYRRVWSMAVYRGRLFAGTLPSGHVHSIEIGRNATCDHALAKGWQHIAAIREAGQLTLYVNGKLVGTSQPFESKEFNLSNNAPLKIGFGTTDHFHGQMSDLRLYRRALSKDEIQQISSSEKQD